MSRYRIVCVGRRARDPLLDAADGYLKRLTRYTKTDLIRIREGTKKDEGKRLLEKIEQKCSRCCPGRTR